jgi:hypothetical protein
MTWTRATVPTGADPDVRSRHLLLVDADGVAGWALRWTGGGWYLSGFDTCICGDGELADAVAVRGLPAVELGDLRWLRGGE